MVVVPYVLVGETVFVGVIQQPRRNQGGVVWNLPRGFIEPGETHQDAAMRELIEETGLVNVGAVVELEGSPGNPNSAFFQTLGNDGIRFYSVAIPPDWVEGDEHELRPQRGTIDPAGVDEAEGTRGLVFRGWAEVARLGDLISVAAVARLLAHLERVRPR